MLWFRLLGGDIALYSFTWYPREFDGKTKKKFWLLVKRFRCLNKSNVHTIPSVAFVQISFPVAGHAKKVDSALQKPQIFCLGSSPALSASLSSMLQSMLHEVEELKSTAATEKGHVWKLLLNGTWWLFPLHMFMWSKWRCLVRENKGYQGILVQPKIMLKLNPTHPVWYKIHWMVCVHLFFTQVFRDHQDWVDSWFTLQPSKLYTRSNSTSRIHLWYP